MDGRQILKWYYSLRPFELYGEPINMLLLDPD